MGEGLKRAFAMAHATNLTKTERLALADCEAHPNGFFWRPKTMAKLAEKGLVAAFVVKDGWFKDTAGYKITAAGRAALRQG